ncbi:MAG: class I SAM-dependent methyltransferase [Candidatus Omnitrophica bacterium]|nr:class I SAM-dependent methyltransferase [Candidatus Omnitrophota bacterium]
MDRYYIEIFLNKHASDIKGRVLEIGDNKYTKLFGGNRVVCSDVLNYTSGNPISTIVGDLTKADHIESNIFDCIILTQTLQMIYDYRLALKHLYRILKPGGILLSTSHGTSKLDRILGVDAWGEYWRFTGQSSKLLFEEFFKPGNVQTTSYGNVLSAISYLHGLASQDLTHDELDFNDPKFEVLVGVRAIK